MVKIYTTPSCSSCRKAKKWFDEHNIKYQEKNLFNFPITKSDIELMLKNAENGFEDIISTRAKIIKDNNIDVNDLKYNELLNLIINNPSILRRPIMIEDRKMQVGYNDEEIRVFIPREQRKNFICESCTDAENCEYTKQLEKYTAKINAE